MNYRNAYSFAPGLTPAVRFLLIALAAQACGYIWKITFDKKAAKFPFFRLLT